MGAVDDALPTPEQLAFAAEGVRRRRVAMQQFMLAGGHVEELANLLVGWWAEIEDAESFGTVAESVLGYVAGLVEPLLADGLPCATCAALPADR